VPQLPHTVWGSFEAPHVGHVDCAGASSLRFADRREWVLDRLVFLFGTAIVAPGWVQG